MILSKKYQGGALVGIFFLTKLLKLQKKRRVKCQKINFFKDKIPINIKEFNQ